MKAKIIMTAVASALVGAMIAILAMLPALSSEPEPLETEVYQACATLVGQETTTTEPTTKVTITEVGVHIDMDDAELIGRVIWGEAGGIKSKTERAAVAWCVLNRVDAWDSSIEAVVTQPNQFHGYRESGECPKEHINLAIDVLTRWTREKNGEEPVGRVLPAEYLYFSGDGSHNYFTEDWRGGFIYQWTLTSPYTD